MKIVTWLGSPRTDGNSENIARFFLEVAAERGADTGAVYSCSKLSFQGCMGCMACKHGQERCILQDELTPALADYEAADVVVLASPVYCCNISGQLKLAFDRTYGFFKPDYLSPEQKNPSRIAGKKALLILSQGSPDKDRFGDIAVRFEWMLKFMGFRDFRLIQVCGNGPESIKPLSAEVQQQARELAEEWVI